MTAGGSGYQSALGEIIRFGEASRRVIPRDLAEEVPIAIKICGGPFAVIMASPLDLIDFAFGFALTEGLAHASDDIRAVHESAEPGAISLDIDLSADALHRHLARGRQRAIVSRTGCGLCGIETTDDMPRSNPVAPAPPLAIAALRAALGALDQHMPLHQRTRAVHAAALADRDGAILALREDVGRHNALDKLIGHVHRQGLRAETGFVLLTSRCSFEMVEKAAHLGLGNLVAISAPTTLALERARDLGIRLYAIARSDGAILFDPLADTAERAA